MNPVDPHHDLRRREAGSAAVRERSRRLRAIAVVCGIVVALFGLVTLLGWIAGADALRSLSPGAITVKTNTAIGLLLTGLALALLAPGTRGRATARVARFAASVAITIGLLTLSEHVVGWDLGIDQLLFREEVGAAATSSPNRMGPPASICFPLLGAALLLVDRRARRAASVAQVLAIVAIAIATLPLLGYVFGVRELYGVARFTAIAFHTAVAFLLLGVGILFARPERGVVRLFVADDSGGELVRRLLPAAILLPILLGWLRIQGQEAGLYDVVFGRTLLVLSFMIAFSTLTWWTGSAVSQQARARERAEGAELELKDRLVRILENISQGFCALDHDGNCTYVNRELERLAGRPRDQLLGRPLDAIWPAARFPALHAAVARASASGAIGHVEIFHDERQAWLDHDVVPTAEGVSLLTRDVTPLKEREEERARLLDSERRARAAAEHSNQMKDEFLATLSHELRTPLNAILGWSTLLAAGGAAADDAAHGIGVIQRNARLQARLIEDLLDMSRIVSGHIRLELQDLDLRTIVDAVEGTVRPGADAKAIRIQTALDPHAGTVRGDPARLQQVLWNLLANAIKFTPEGGNVRVSLERAGGAIELSVSDDGIGIPPEFLPQVFDRFRQADASTTRRHGGVGLGLSIARQLAEMHGGTLEAHSAGAGLGSRFTLRLPASRGIPIARTTRDGARGADDRRSLAGVRVLVVDDEEDARDVVERILRDHGADVDTARGSDAAFELLARRSFDVLVSDIAMPERDGYSLLREVRDRYGALAAIALTAFARDEDRQRALDAGYQLHLPKPVHPEPLVAAVARLARPSTTFDGDDTASLDYS